MQRCKQRAARTRSGGKGEREGSCEREVRKKEGSESETHSDREAGRKGCSVKGGKEGE